MRPFPAGWVRAWAWLVALLCGLLALPLVAQTVTPRTEAQKQADVQFFLQNDEDVAKVKQQFAAKEINNVEYARRQQELKKARDEVYGRYDRAGQKEILVLYNATKRDLAIAARDAERKAKAQAAAELQATRQAAQEEARAKQEAARVAATAGTQAKAEAAVKAITDDAQAYTDVAMRHDKLHVKSNVQPLTPAELDEMTRLKAQGAEIKKKYDRGGEMFFRTNEFGLKLAQFEKEQIAPAAKDWVAAVFPEPAQVVAGFDDNTKRAAALMVVVRALRETVVPPFPAATEEKLRAYQSALDQVDPPAGSQHAGLAREARALAEAPQFRIEVAKKFLGAYGTRTMQVAQEDIRRARVRAEWRALNWKINLIFLGLMILPLLYLAYGQRPKGKPDPTVNNPIKLPADLARIKVLRKEYPVRFDCGKIYEKEVWTETTSTTTTTPGQTVYQGGVPVSSTPSTTTTHVSSTTYHQYWIRTPDGRETWQRFSDKIFMASKEQLISVVDFNTSILIAYNHSMGEFVPLKRGIRDAHGFPGGWLWLLNVAAGTAAFFYLGKSVSPDFLTPDDHPWSHIMQVGIMMAVVGSAIYLGILTVIVQMIRTAQFKRHYLPRFREFMEQRTPELVRHYAVSSATPKPPP